MKGFNLLSLNAFSTCGAVPGTMRQKGTKYEHVETIPTTALPVSVYAERNDIRNPAYVCVKYDRYLTNKGKYPGYIIVCWNGTNMVIPD